MSKGQTLLCTSMLQEPFLITFAHQQMLSLTGCCAELPQWVVDCSNAPRLGCFAAPGVSAVSGCTPTPTQWTAADAESLSMQSRASHCQGVPGFLRLHVPCRLPCNCHWFIESLKSSRADNSKCDPCLIYNPTLSPNSYVTPMALLTSLLDPTLLPLPPAPPHTYPPLPED